MMTLSTRRLAQIVLLAAAPLGALAAQDVAANPAAAFDSSIVMIPTRDGVRLNTKIFVPKNATLNLPIIFTRTPYGIARSGATFATSYSDLAAEGFIFVFQDIRGRFGSEGQFVMLR